MLFAPRLMGPIVPFVLATVLLAPGCSRSPEPEEEPRPMLERAQEKLAQSVDKVRVAAREKWIELRPEAERAVGSLEERLAELARNEEAMKRLPPETVERIRARVAALRQKLAEANAAHQRGDTDLAVEKADDVAKESEAIEEMLVERPDDAGSSSDAKATQGR